MGRETASFGSRIRDVRLACAMVGTVTSQNLTRKPLARSVEPLIREALADTPVTVIQGARQVGKSWLAEHVVNTVGGKLLSLDDSDTLTAARNDPDGFVRQPVTGTLALDEVQRVPELIRAIKSAVDNDRRAGRFLLTGSADLLHLPGADESLAGRAETVPLFGFSQGELAGGNEDFVQELITSGEDWIASRSSELERADYAHAVCAGSYPEAVSRTGRRRERWMTNYVRRVVAHDAAEVSRLIHVDRLERLLSVLAANNSGELVKARIARDLEMPETTLPPYLRLLADLYLVHALPAWGRNLTRRVVGRPKVSLLDTGLAAHLIGQNPDRLSSPTGNDHLGGLLEAFVAGELRRQQGWSEIGYQIHHFRDRDGYEVDLVLESPDGTIVGIEVKSSRSVTVQHFRPLELLRDRLGTQFIFGLVLHTGPRATRFGDRLWSAPVSALWSTG